MTYKGLAKGRLIELDTPLPYPDGQVVRVTVEPADEAPRVGSACLVRKLMHEPPHVEPQDVDELEALIREGRRPARFIGTFDGERES